MREKDQTGKKLTNNLLIEKGVSCYTGSTIPTLRVPTCPLVAFSCFRLHHPQTQQKSAILTSSKLSQKEVSFMGGTISHVAVNKLYTQNILYSDRKILPAV
jgi:hypothetical protein